MAEAPKHLDEETARDRRIASLMNKIQKNGAIPEENRKAVVEWLDYLSAKGIAQNTVIKHLYCMERFLTYLPKDTALRVSTREDVQSAIAKLEREDYAEATKHNIKVVAKAFYKHYLGEDEFYPRQVSWLKGTINKSKKRLPEVLSEDEVLKMIKLASNTRDKALIALLYDSGVRVGELLGMKIKDIELDKEPAHIIVNGKTGMRKIPILFSAPYLAVYLDTINDKKPQDPVWTALGSWSKINYRIKESGVRKILQETAKRAGIDKRIYPHLFRHSRATYYANKLTEQQLKAFFGWTGDSKMVSTYVHMSGRDIDDAILQVHGKKPAEVLAPKLTERVCPRCRYANGIDFLHCKRCGAPLDIQTFMQEQERAKILNDYMVKVALEATEKDGLLAATHKKLKENRKQTVEKDADSK